LDLAPPAIAAPQAQTATPFPDTVPPIDGPAPILLSVTVDTDTDTSTVLNFHLGTRYAGQPQIQKPDPDTLQIILPGLAGVVPGQYTVDTKAIESLSSAVNGGKTTLTVKLARPMGAQVIAGPEGVSLLLYKPNVGNGKIAGKLIVVDPGHGGHDSGATSGELREKDLNLSIGLQLARKLAQAGATVILTRQTDVFIPLMTRSVISNDAHADFFISCHINSTGNSERLSGTTTYHHIGNKVAYLLAESIQHEIAKVNGLPNKGAVSDGTIYSSGFSVLRHTTAPAVLVEMGFINHPKDRARMQSKDFQDSVTNAIVKGVRVFLGDVKPNE
jgi:N-acetylmuramoyl-L-alanine amidase